MDESSTEIVRTEVYTSDNYTGTLLATFTPSLTIAQQYIVNVTYILIAFVGILGNLVSLIVILTHPPIRRRSLNYYFINKTVVDLLVSLILIPSVTVNLIPFGYSTYFLCLFWQSRVFFVSLCNVSIYSILALSLERYLEIVHPIWHKINVTRAKIISTVIGCWLIVFVQKFCYILPTTGTVNGVCVIGKYFPNRTTSSVAGFLSCFTDFIFPISLILFCYIQMWRSLRPRIKPHPGSVAVELEQSENKLSVSRARRRIFKTLVIIATLFVLTNTYKGTLLLLKLLFIVPLDLNSINFNISQILSFLHCAIDPFVYVLNHREFQIGFYKLFRFQKLMKRTETGQF